MQEVRGRAVRMERANEQHPKTEKNNLWWVIISESMGNTAFIHSQSNDIKCEEAGK